MGRFTNPLKIDYTFATTDTWAISFEDGRFNLIESTDGVPLFPASSLLFREINAHTLGQSIRGFNLELPVSFSEPVNLTVNLIDTHKSEILQLVLEWIKDSPVYQNSRTLKILGRPSEHTKLATLYRLDKTGAVIDNIGKKSFYIFPSGDIVNEYNSESAVRMDSFEFRCY